MMFTDEKYLLINTNFPKTIINALVKYGIISLIQFSELLQKSPLQLEKVTNTTKKKLKTYLEDEPIQIPMISNRGYRNFAQPPLSGYMDKVKQSPALLKRRKQLSKERRHLSEAIKKLNKENDLPTKMDLTHHLPAIRNQGGLGSCVGFGSTAAREFPVYEDLSPGWAYNGAKKLDCFPNEEGSCLYYAFEYFYKVGHVPEDVYTYQDAINKKPMETYYNFATKFKIDGFVDLLLDTPDLQLMPTLFKGILSGHLLPELGPQPISIGIALKESAQSASTYRSGVFTIPLPGELCIGGHAMAIVGYIEKEDPSNPYNESYFIVRNSWGTDWAHESPLNMPGHALIPEAYFTNNNLIHESILCVAETSPMKGLTNELLKLWKATKKIIGN